MIEKAFSIQAIENVPVVNFINYCNNETLADLARTVCELCDQDSVKFIFNFEECQLINSLGLATLLEVLMLIQDYEGQVVVTGLDATKQKFFNLTGVFALASFAQNISEAQKLLQV